MNYSRELLKIAKDLSASNKKINDFNKFDYEDFLGYVRQELEKNNQTKDVSRYYIDGNELDIIYDQPMLKITFKFQISGETITTSVYEGNSLKNFEKGNVYNDVDRVVKFIVNELKYWN